MEDGHIFFADAYNFGWWRAFLGVYAGYLHALPRIGADLALLVPLMFAPLVINLIAIAVQALPVNLLLSSRSVTWGSPSFRALMVGIFLALPNCWEIDANINNSQWFLSLSAFLLLTARKPSSMGGRIFDFSLLLLCALTGPFCVFLLPIAAILLWQERDLRRWVQAGILAAGFIVQTTWSLLKVGSSGRPHYDLGANPVMFARVLAGQVYLGTLLGGIRQGPHLSPGYMIGFIVIAIAGTILVVICVQKSQLPMRLFLFFAFMVFAASLKSPTLGPPNGVPAWVTFASGAGNRYWFLPSLAFGWTLAWCYFERRFGLKAISAVLLCIMCFASALHWRYPAFQDQHFAEFASAFEAAPSGTVVTIPEYPAGWTLTLVKHGLRPR